MRMSRRDAVRILGASALLALSLTLPIPAAADEMGTAVRVMATDAANGDLTVIDPESGEIVGRFTTPTGGYTYVYPSENGRYLLTNHYAGEHVTIVDAGLGLEPHGDHADLVTNPPFVLATVATGSVPAHYAAHDGIIAIHNDGDGTITILDESELARKVDPFTFAVAQPDHTSIAIINDTVLVGYYDLGRVDAYSLDGELIAEGVGDCPGTHGEARFGDSVAFACGDGVLLVTPDGDHFTTEKVAYPGSETDSDLDATPVADGEAPRIGSIAAHHDNDVLVGDFGAALALMTPHDAGLDIAVLPLSGEALAFTYDHLGEHVTVLTDDGQVHGVDPNAGEVLWSTPAVTPYTEIELGDGFDFWPKLAASDTALYVADPKAGEIVEIDLESGEVLHRFAIGGQPARVTLTLASGVQH